jgi:hypothetical protein
MTADSQTATEMARNVTRDARGRVLLPLDPAAPPLGMKWPALAKLLADRERIERDSRDVKRAQRKLAAAVTEAQQKDTRALAERLRGGGREVGDIDEHERAAREALMQAQRRGAALAEAAKMVEDEIAALVGSRAPKWAEECRERETGASERLEAAAAEMIEAHAELRSTRLLLAWCENPAMRVKPGWTPPDTVPLGYLDPAGDQATMSVGEFVGLVLEHETRPDPTITSTLPAPIGGSQ